ncbi:MAG: 5'/3'-nucleotidase SurE [Bacteroidetes bacterium]|jgi:5'-nucleotidase|nr:5'/3'-nucleotidase SurE [Bacteroidota bacterium]MDA0732503.1 5'/3'-nucleotidase SurE [Bacteroidota bacterium]MDA0981100.1 5'/3'-nucleotidase SurE [Bacteroidota bacterium]|tara:strand:+ start:784 stop:1560 length:777 start_codon:yes stop_codon:yes gene_type:complete
MSKRPLILITNDDGISSKGISSLAEAVLDLGDIHVVAPDSPQSGMGHAVTIGEILRIKSAYFPIKGVTAHSTSGTPVDCVKLAIYKVLGRKPDLILSGINHGSNSSINVIYSGTMSAAVEGAVESINAIGFSLLDHDPDADFTNAKKVVRQMTMEVLKRGLPHGVCLNVNIPKISEGEELKGIKVCRQAAGYWEDGFDERKAPNKESYFWLTGEFTNPDKGEDTDEYALSQGYASVVPTQFDLTAHHAISELNSWGLT